MLFALAALITPALVAAVDAPAKSLLANLEKSVDRVIKKPAHRARGKDKMIRAIVDRAGRTELDTLFKGAKGGNAISKKLVGGWFPLHIAGYAGAHEAVQYFIDEGADMEAKDGLGMTPIHVAQLAGKRGAAELMLESLSEKATNTSLAETNRLLQQAVIAGYTKDVRSLVENSNADVNSLSASGWTALHLAAFQGNLELSKFLLDQGASLDVRDEKGLVPLNLAQLGGYKPVVEFLKEKAAAEGGLGDQMAVGKLFLETVKLALAAEPNEEETGAQASRKQKEAAKSMLNLIGAGVDVNSRLEGPGWSALHIVCKSIHSKRQRDGANIIEEALKVLIDNGADPTLRDADGKTPLQLAQLHANTDAIKYLSSAEVLEKQKGSAPLEIDPAKQAEMDTMFVQAVRMALRPKNAGGTAEKKKEFVNIFKNLLSSGADIDAQDDEANNRWTALHWAALAADQQVVKYLLKKGADVYAEDKDGYSALNLAQLSGHVEVSEMIRTKGDPPQEQEGDVKVHVVGGGNAATHMGKDVNELFIDAAKFALGTGQLLKLKNLLATGANVNATSKDERLWTAMHMAAHKGMKNVTDLLLANGPLNLDAVDGHHYTALHFAAVNGHLKTVHTLVEAGASIDIKNKDGDTPRMVAENQKEFVIAEFLQQAEEDLAELAAFADMDEDDEGGEL
jgi:ankyrin repeat protein